MKETIKKFRFKDVGIAINAPSPLKEELIELGFTTSFEKNKQSSNTLIFINNAKEFVDFLTNDLKNITPDSVLWFAYPKGTSKIKTDIHRDIIRVKGQEFGITTVSAVSINDTWSALRFRPIDRVGK